jgi:hypothetical protein
MITEADRRGKEGSGAHFLHLKKAGGIEYFKAKTESTILYDTADK